MYFKYSLNTAFLMKNVCCKLNLVSHLQMTALAGNYVNFGVFELYGDRALSDALDVALKMTLSIPLADILAFRKVCELFSLKA